MQLHLWSFQLFQNRWVWWWCSYFGQNDLTLKNTLLHECAFCKLLLLWWLNWKLPKVLSVTILVFIQTSHSFCVCLCLTRRHTHQHMTQRPIFLPSSQSLMISKPQPTSHSRPVFIVMLRLRCITKTTICSRTWLHFYFFLLQKQREEDKSLSSSLLKIGFSLEAHCDTDGPSRMENWFPAIISCRLLSTLGTTLTHTPIIFV